MLSHAHLHFLPEGFCFRGGLVDGVDAMMEIVWERAKRSKVDENLRMITARADMDWELPGVKEESVQRVIGFIIPEGFCSGAEIVEP
jgi:hypothetical protein